MSLCSLPTQCTHAAATTLTSPTPHTQVVVGLVAWSLYTKKETGSGLPAGPGGVLGAAEGFSYLSLVAGVVVAGLNAAGL